MVNFEMQGLQPSRQRSTSPFFSIVTVCRNVETIISETGRSLSAQSFGDYEWLVVDGASIDRTLAQVDAIAIENKRVVSEPDSGIYDAMNKAVGLAKGKWIYFLNAADELDDPFVLADVNKHIIANEGAKLVYGDVRYVGKRHIKMRRFSHVSKRMLVFEDLNHQAVFARHELFEKIGRFDLRFPYSADYDWLIRVFASGVKTSHLTRPIAKFMEGGAHASNLRELGLERRALRLQYVSTPELWFGSYLAKARRRYCRWRDR